MDDSKYVVEIVLRDFQECASDWHAMVTRKSDGKQIIDTSWSLRLLKWRTRRKVLDRTFEDIDAYEAFKNQKRVYEV